MKGGEGQLGRRDQGRRKKNDGVYEYLSVRAHPVPFETRFLQQFISIRRNNIRRNGWTD